MPRATRDKAEHNLDVQNAGLGVADEEGESLLPHRIARAWHSGGPLLLPADACLEINVGLFGSPEALQHCVTWRFIEDWQSSCHFPANKKLSRICALTGRFFAEST